MHMYTIIAHASHASVRRVCSTSDSATNDDANDGAANGQQQHHCGTAATATATVNCRDKVCQQLSDIAKHVS